MAILHSLFSRKIEPETMRKFIALHTLSSCKDKFQRDSNQLELINRDEDTKPKLKPITE